jgi:3-phosphoshikimate 1-carboxyvinyltransferase
VTDFLVRPAVRPLRGSIPTPPDKSVTHRALMLAAIADGTSRIALPKMGDDNRSTLECLRALGVVATEDDGGVTIEGRGMHGLAAPSGDLDCGNSGTTMRLLAGLLAAQRFRAVMTGDASLSRRPMARIATPLRLRGARIEGALDPKRPGDVTAPLVIGPLPEPNVLSALRYDLPIPSAQVKSALLLSGLYADGPTVVSEPLLSRDHTERMLAALGVPVGRVGSVVELDGPSFSGHIDAFDIAVPGDLSAAAFILAAATLVPESEVSVRGVGINPTRGGFLDLVKLMGGALAVSPRGDSLGEPFGEVTARAATVVGAKLGGEAVVRAIDEVPILAAMAARARGTTEIRDAAELRVKESDRIAAMVGVLRAFGVECDERPDGLVVSGRPDAPLRAATVEAHGDHRIAMSAAVLGLFADGESRIVDVDAVATSFPRFAGTMRAIGADVRAV